MARTVWHEVIERRHELHRGDTDREGMEYWPAADLQWLQLLDDLHADVKASRENPRSERDIRAAVVDHIAALSAWCDAMDARGPIA